MGATLNLRVSTKNGSRQSLRSEKDKVRITCEIHDPDSTGTISVVAHRMAGPGKLRRLEACEVVIFADNELLFEGKLVDLKEKLLK